MSPQPATWTSTSSASWTFPACVEPTTPRGGAASTWSVRSAPTACRSQVGYGVSYATDRTGLVTWGCAFVSDGLGPMCAWQEMRWVSRLLSRRRGFVYRLLAPDQSPHFALLVDKAWLSESWQRTLSTFAPFNLSSVPSPLPGLISSCLSCSKPSR